MSKVTELNNLQARELLIHPDSYCNFNLPPYFSHKNLLDTALGIVSSDNYRSGEKPGDLESINHTILANKDGAYAWRPFQLVHPVMYIEMVNKITERDNWDLIQSKFKEFSEDKKIKALNIPDSDNVGKEGVESTINNWWKNTEQRTTELSLDFSYLSTTDISDCYGSIYTHTVSWALHTKGEAKKKENRNDQSLLGNNIDNFLQDMHNRQTNGIPQGNTVSDLIAELILGYADAELSKKLTEVGITDYKILRYRDDYRIFTNSRSDSSAILLWLTNILADLNLKLNPTKTGTTGDIVSGAVRADKLGWILSDKTGQGFLHMLIKIREFSKEFPNSGSLTRTLSGYRKDLEDVVVRPHQNLSLIAILTDIMLHSPRIYATGASILAKLLSFEPQETRTEILSRVRNKFKDVPNIGDLDIWLQRISIKTHRDYQYSEPLCQLVSGTKQALWDSSWLAKKSAKALDECKFIDEDTIGKLDDIPSVSETEIYVKALSPDYAMELSNE